MDFEYVMFKTSQDMSTQNIDQEETQLCEFSSILKQFSTFDSKWEDVVFSMKLCEIKNTVNQNNNCHNGKSCHTFNDCKKVFFINRECTCWERDLNIEKRNIFDRIENKLKEDQNYQRDMVYVIEGKPGTGKSTLITYLMKHTVNKCVFLAFKHHTLESIKHSFLCCDKINFKMPNCFTIHSFIMKYINIPSNRVNDFFELLNEPNINIQTLEEWTQLKSELSVYTSTLTDFLMKHDNRLIIIIDECFLINKTLLYVFFNVCCKIRAKFYSKYNVKFLFILAGSQTQCLSIGSSVNTNFKDFINSIFGGDDFCEYHYLKIVNRTKSESLNRLINFIENDSNNDKNTEEETEERNKKEILKFYKNLDIMHEDKIIIDIERFALQYIDCVSLLNGDYNNLQQLLSVFSNLEERLIIMCSTNIFCHFVLSNFYNILFNRLKYQIENIDKLFVKYNLFDDIATYLIVGMSYIIIGNSKNKIFRNRTKVRLLRINKEDGCLKSVIVSFKNQNGDNVIVELFVSYLQDYHGKQRLFSLPIRPYFVQTIYQFQGETFDETYNGYGIFRNHENYRNEYVFVSRFKSQNSIMGVIYIDE